MNIISKTQQLIVSMENQHLKLQPSDVRQLRAKMKSQRSNHLRYSQLSISGRLSSFVVHQSHTSLRYLIYLTLYRIRIVFLYNSISLNMVNGNCIYFIIFKHLFSKPILIQIHVLAPLHTIGLKEKTKQNKNPQIFSICFVSKRLAVVVSGGQTCCCCPERPRRPHLTLDWQPLFFIATNE